MKTLRTSTIPHLAAKMKKSTINTRSGSGRGGHSLRAFLGIGAIFALIIAAAFYTSSAASSSGGGSLNSSPKAPASGKKIFNISQSNSAKLPDAGKLLSGFLPVLMPQAPADEAIATYEVVGGVCTEIPKSSFLLGETVCVRASNAPLRTPTALRRFNWADTNGFVRQSEDVIADPDTNLFTLPVDNTSIIAGETLDNRGTWSASINSTENNMVRAIAYFKVSDPANSAADLAIYNFSTETDTTTPGANTGFFLWLSNTGPDPAENVHVTQATPPNLTFAGTTQHTGPSFTCQNLAGVTDCSIASLPSGSIATLTINYTVDSGAPNGVISSVADISGDTNDPRPDSNSSEARVEVFTAGAPPATCALGCPSDLIVTANATQGPESGAFVTFAAGNVEVSGDCGTIDTTPASGAFFPVGSTAVTATSSTGGGSCSFTVTVLDTAAPTITCAADQTATATGSETEVAVTVNAPTATTGTGVSVSGVRNDNRAVSDPYPVGTTTITWTATDSDGRTASCTQRIIVTSADAPTISCPTDKTFNATGCDITVTAGDIGSPTATGSGVTVTSRRSDDLPLTDPFPAGQTIITWTATDDADRVVSCTQRITVTTSGGGDTEPPTLTVPANVEVFTSSCSRLIDDLLGAAVANDNCSNSVAISRSGIPAGNIFPVGVTTITYTATDASNNVTTGTQLVTVKESSPTPPTIQAPAAVTLHTGSGATSCGVTVADLDATLGTATASDNCGNGPNGSNLSVARSGVPADGTFPLGNTTVTYTATDVSGNSASAQQVVTVVDNTAPTITAPADSSANADASCQAAVPDYTAGTTAADNCGNVTLSQSPAAGTLVGFGPHTVTVTADDGHGNTSSDDVVFTVNDVTPPTITAPADSAAFADASCLAAVPDYRPGTVAADNCGSVTLSQSPAPGTLVGFGPHTVTVTADDGHGNTASEDVVFTVNDNTPPVFTSCPSNITLEPTCPTGAIATYATPTATDNCGATVTRTAGPASGSIFPIGTTTVTHVADDGHGNTATCTFTVTVLTPQAVVQNLINEVNNSSLTGTQKNGLLAKLNAALDGINQGKINVACNKLSDFVNSVENLISHGDITAAQGNAWISSANHVRNTIGCTSLACS